MLTTMRKPDHRCVWCGLDFESPKFKNGSTTKRQIIWIRMWIRLNDQLVFLRGSVDGSCRNELQDLQVSSLSMAK